MNTDLTITINFKTNLKEVAYKAERVVELYLEELVVLDSNGNEIVCADFEVDYTVEDDGNDTEVIITDIVALEDINVDECEIKKVGLYVDGVYINRELKDMLDIQVTRIDATVDETVISFGDTEVELIY